MVKINLNTIVENANPINWTPESKRVVLKVVGITLITFATLTALENLPTAMAAGSKFFYDCALSAEANAIKAYAEVLYNTMDLKKAGDASNFMYEIGKKVDGAVSGRFLTSVCQHIANNLPYNY